MTVMETQPRGIARPDLSFSYLMTGIAIGCIVVSGTLGSIFTPVMVMRRGFPKQRRPHLGPWRSAAAGTDAFGF